MRKNVAYFAISCTYVRISIYVDSYGKNIFFFSFHSKFDSNYCGLLKIQSTIWKYLIQNMHMQSQLYSLVATLIAAASGETVTALMLL